MKWVAAWCCLLLIMMWRVIVVEGMSCPCSAPFPCPPAHLTVQSAEQDSSVRLSGASTRPSTWGKRVGGHAQRGTRFAVACHRYVGAGALLVQGPTGKSGTSSQRCCTPTTRCTSQPYLVLVPRERLEALAVRRVPAPSAEAGGWRGLGWDPAGPERYQRTHPASHGAPTITTTEHHQAVPCHAGTDRFAPAPLLPCVFNPCHSSSARPCL
jgi:hypothetical protein